MKRRRLLWAVMIAQVACLYAAASTLYVALDGSDTPPFVSLETAAQTLQQAAEMAKSGDEILVAPGVYTNGGAAAGSTLTNRVVVPDGVSLRSIEGPEKTIIEGVAPCSSNAVRCVKLGFASSIQGFTIRDGGTRSYLQDVYKAQSGGGVMCEDGARIIGCIIVNNDAYNYGGGVYGGTVERSVIAGNAALRGGGVGFSEVAACAVVHNSVTHIGGGVYRASVRHSTVTSNRASYAAGGTYETDAADSVIIDNYADWIAPNHKWGIFSNVYTDPIPERGTNNTSEAAEVLTRGLGAPREVIDMIPSTLVKRRAEPRNGLDRRKAQMGLIDLPPRNRRKEDTPSSPAKQEQLMQLDEVE